MVTDVECGIFDNHDRIIVSFCTSVGTYRSALDLNYNMGVLLFEDTILIRNIVPYEELPQLLQQYPHHQEAIDFLINLKGDKATGVITD